ncbi:MULTISPECIES: hypothetical protein [unclassified Bradyrhizobium]|uniref:hypothetical protein n=1 Tax=unclassified Bradyrhizobium TaxID=2631580 RepID=UPI0020B2EDF4|nr:MULTISPECIES: hypothetical protein [unclassified Bradyrhizobium]MCP3396524.1 hypothetical protein [Bradyrhizobium sp. CCGB20]MCP3405038.1 hypothetical protein [Bradyrhizobium sp. CCGB01]
MIIPTHFGPAAPLWRAQMWQARAFSRLVSLDLMAVDLRFAFASVVTRSLVQAADALVRHVMGRAWRGARFAEDITAAATMVAAARH